MKENNCIVISKEMAVHRLELLKTEDVERHDHVHLYKIMRTPRKIIETILNVINFLNNYW